MTLNELFNQVWETHWNQPRFKMSGWSIEVNKYWRAYIDDKLGSRDIEKITRKDIRKFQMSLADRPTTANRCLEVISRLYSFAEEFEMTESNPCHRVKAFPERKRDRYATPIELARIGELLKSYELVHPREVAFIRLMIFTGSRPRALMRAKRSQLLVQGDTGVLRSDGKSTASSGREELVVFPKPALIALSMLPVRADGLLIGEVSYRRVWDKLRHDAQCSDLWLRDLRRTYATIGFSAGLSLGHIGALLNHSSLQTTEIYAKLLPTARINSANQIAEELSRIIQ